MALLVAGSALAIVQPGDLGDDDAAPATTVPPGETTTVPDDTTTVPDDTTTVPDDTTTVPDTTGPDTTAPGEATTVPPGPTTTVPDDEVAAPPTTQPSGIGANGAGPPRSDEIADTGGEALIGAGLLLLAAGMATQHLQRRRTA